MSNFSPREIELLQLLKTQHDLGTGIFASQDELINLQAGGLVRADIAQVDPATGHIVFFLEPAGVEAINLLNTPPAPIQAEVAVPVAPFQPAPVQLLPTVPEQPVATIAPPTPTVPEVIAGGELTEGMLDTPAPVAFVAQDNTYQLGSNFQVPIKAARKMSTAKYPFSKLEKVGDFFFVPMSAEYADMKKFVNSVRSSVNNANKKASKFVPAKRYKAIPADSGEAFGEGDMQVIAPCDGIYVVSIDFEVVPTKAGTEVPVN